MDERGQNEYPAFVDTLAGETKSGADDAARLPGRLARYARAHRRALDMASFADGKGEVKLSAALRGCGHNLRFRDYFTIGRVKLYKADFCKRHLLCPLCAIRRGAKLVEAYLCRLEALLNQYPTAKAYHVVITVKNGSDLGERFNHLRKSLRKMSDQKRDAKKGRRPPIELSKALGVVGSFEFKRGRNSGEWHPHSHQVWLCEEIPDPERLSAEWKEITGDSINVYIDPLEEDLITGFLEVFKYALKFSALTLEDNWQGFKTLSGRRLVFAQGAFYDVEVSEDLTDDQFESLPFVELLYEYVHGLGYELKDYRQARAGKLVEFEYRKGGKEYIAVGS